MQYSIAKEIFGSPWHMHVSGIQQYMPIVRGMMSGLLFSTEKEPKENLPFVVSTSTHEAISGYYAEDQEDEVSAEEPDKVEEKVVFVLPVKGVMMRDDMECGPRGTRTLANRLLQADNDESVIGHVMIIDGPGGSSQAIPYLTDTMQQCTKPIVVWIDGMACSAHQYVAAYGVERIASRETDYVGCIGTMMTFSGRTAKSEANLLGEREVTIYADDAYEKNEEYETAINSFDFKLTKELILNPHNTKFQADMKKQLPGIKDEHLHGRTFPAGEVIGSLVDSIGTFEDAVNRVIELSGHKEDANSQSQGSSGSQTELNNQMNMSKKYLNIEKALGSESLEFEADGSRTFSDDEMIAVDNALGSATNKVLQDSIDSANLTIGQQVETISGHQATIGQQAETISGHEATIEQQRQTLAERDHRITELETENASLRAQSAGASGKARTETDPSVSGKKGEAKAITSKYENPLDAIDEISEEFLGRKVNE